MSTPKFKAGDYVQVLSSDKLTQDKKIIIDSSIVIDVVRLPMPMTKDPNIVVKNEIYGYVLCPHPGPENACVAETALRKRPIAGIGWDAIQIWCKWMLNP